MKLYLLVAFFGSLCIQFVVTKDDCEIAKSCEECTKMMHCTWCEKAENISSTIGRCRPTLEDLPGWNEDCGQQFTAESGHIISLKDLPLSFSDEVSSEILAPEHPVLIRPQKLSMKLKPVHPQNVTVNIRLYPHEPVDIYLLIDFSDSTSQYKSLLSTLVQKILKKMPKITSNFRIGFGSIIPCGTCALSSGFKNFLTLTRNLQIFVERINNFIRNAVAVPPSDKLDVILQAIKCNREIGWRKNAKKLLVFTSNATLIKNRPRQGEFDISIRSNASEHCELDREGFFPRNGNYPFIHEVSNALQTEMINIIFVAPIPQIDNYYEISGLIRNSFTSMMTAAARAAMRTLRIQIERLGKIGLRDRAKKPVSLRYFSHCGRKEAEREISLCRKIDLTKKIQFTIEVAVDGCPTGQFPQRQTLEIFGMGFSGQLSLDVEIIGGCECANVGNQIVVNKAPECHFHGRFQNGDCECMTGYYGSRCEFGNSPPNWGALDENRCKVSPESQVCSGSGTCIDGACQCYERYDPTEIISGRFCECSNFLCPYSNGLICSFNGICRCNECVCHPGWTGEACEYSTHTYNCVAPGTGEICSLHGSCVDNRCTCFSTYSGKYCEDCPTCRSKCDLFRPCVECKLNDMMESVTGDCEEVCTRFGINLTIPVYALKVNDSDGERLCHFIDTHDCRLKFVYGSKNFGAPYIRVQTNFECPVPQNSFNRFLDIISTLLNLL